MDWDVLCVECGEQEVDRGVKRNENQMDQQLGEGQTKLVKDGVGKGDVGKVRVGGQKWMRMG